MVEQRRRSRKYQNQVPCESCTRPILAELGYQMCLTCWMAIRTCRRESVTRLDELADPRKATAPLLWRVADILRRSGVEDAEALIEKLERHFN